MSTEQLKALVIEKLMYEQDETVLENVLNLLSEHEPAVVNLTPEQLASIGRGEADYAAGRYVTQEDLERDEF